MQYIGIDVSMKSLQVSDTSGKRHIKLPNDEGGIQQLLLWLANSESKPHVVVEPTSVYHQPVVMAMAKAQVTYSLINPAQAAAFATLQQKRAKTDKVDARLLAQFGESQRPEPSEKPDEEREQLRALRRHLEWIQQEIQRTRNRLGTARFSPWTPASVLESLERTVAQLEAEAKHVEEKLRKQANEKEERKNQMRLLTSIPGIGEKTAILILSELPDVAKCKNAKSWVAYAGVNPEPRQSGGSEYSRLSRKGSARVRARLFTPAMSAVRWNPYVRAQSERLKEKNAKGRPRVSAAMNKLLRIAFGVLKSGIPFDAEYRKSGKQEESAGAGGVVASTVPAAA